MAQAAGLTTSGSRSRLSDADADRHLEIQRRESHTGAQAPDWTAKAELEEKEVHIEKLKKVVNDQTNRIIRLESEVNRYKQWADQDNSLSEDAMTKDAIEDHRIKTMAAAEKQSKEIQDAAYQTVKTLKDMLEQKNTQLKRKEEQIERLRDQMKAQSALDAATINELRE